MAKFTTWVYGNNGSPGRELALDEDDRYSPDGLQLRTFCKTTFYPGVTVLIGCNGSGKTTLLQTIALACKDADIPCYKYYGLEARDKISFDAQVNSDTNAALQMINSNFMSEGERLFDNMAYLVNRLGQFVLRDNRYAPEVLVLIDSMDSGLSLDLQDEFGSFLDDMAGKLKPDGMAIYVIMAANSYEYASWAGWTAKDVQEGTDVTFSSYEDYKKFVLETKVKKDKWVDEYNERSANGKRIF